MTAGTYTVPYIHICIHTRIHTCIHTYTNRCMYTNMHTYNIFICLIQYAMYCFCIRPSTIYLDHVDENSDPDSVEWMAISSRHLSFCLSLALKLFSNLSLFCDFKTYFH